MSRKFRTRWLVALVTAGGLTFAGLAQVRADDPKADAKPPAAGDKPAAAEADPYAVPEGTPEELLKFIQKIEKSRPTNIKSFAELHDYVVKSRKAALTAADKILAAKPDDKIRVAAIKAKFGALEALGQMGDADAAKDTKELLDQIKDDKNPQIARIAKVFGFKARAAEALGSREAAEKLWDDIKAELTAAPDDKEMIMFAASYGNALERARPKVAVAVLTDLSEIAAKSSDPDIKALGKKFEGVLRRLTLMGKPMEIKGTLVDGTPFDPASLKGKVVLVDFWATWCGPCRAELPNVKANYEKYHDKGFEVVGVSLDQSAEPLKKFIADEKLPWPILFPQEKKDQYWSNPLAVYYGVNAIPCVILMDQNGNVVSLNARGPELGKKLEELLGKADDKPAADAADKKSEAKAESKSATK